MAWYKPKDIYDKNKKTINAVATGGLSLFADKAKDALEDLTESSSTAKSDWTSNQADTLSRTEALTPYADTTADILGLGSNANAIYQQLLGNYNQDQEANQEVEEAQRGLANQFYRTAMTPIDGNLKANEAEAGIIKAMNKGKDAYMQNLGSYGINPNKVAGNERAFDIATAEGIAGARQAALDKAEEDSFKRMLSGMSTYGATTGDSSASDIINALQTGGSLFSRLLTPKGTTTSGTANTTGSGTGKQKATSNPSLWDTIFGKGTSVMDVGKGIFSMF